MRFAIPLTPVAVVIHFERRPLGRLHPRISVRGLLVLTAVLAVYLTVVTLPARRVRYQRAEQVFRKQLALLVRAAEEERGREREIRGRLERDLAATRREETEAARWPEASDKRNQHQHLARLWIEAARRVPVQTADSAAMIARAYERRAEELRKGQRHAGTSLARFERLAREAEAQPSSPEWKRLDLPARLADVRSRMQSEQQQQAIKAFLALRSSAALPGITRARTPAR